MHFTPGLDRFGFSQAFFPFDHDDLACPRTVIESLENGLSDSRQSNTLTNGVSVSLLEFQERANCIFEKWNRCRFEVVRVQLRPTLHCECTISFICRFVT